jgi:signal transduction histidine kinase
MDSPPGRAIRIAERISLLFSTVLISFGAAVVIGQILNIPFLKVIFSPFYLTPFCFFLSGTGLWFSQVKKRYDRLSTLFAAASVVMLLLISFKVFIINLPGHMNAVWFFSKGIPGALWLSSPVDFMPLNTAANFVLIAFALFLLQRRWKGLLYVTQLLVLIILGISYLTLIGFLYGARPVFSGAVFSTDMDLLSTVLFIMLCIGILCSRPTYGFMAYITSDLLGARIFRRLFPAAVMIPAALGFMKIHAHNMQLLSDEFGMSLVAFGNTSVIVIYSFFLAILLGRSEKVRRQRWIYDQLLSEVLNAVNTTDDFNDLIKKILSAIKSSTRCDAAGLRLKSGEDFPYFCQEGFSPDFLLTENNLVVRDAGGAIRREPDGGLCLACTCGLVISEKADTADPLFTSSGSFWTNNSAQILDLPPCQDQRRAPRNKCVREGFSSIAIIPVREKKRVIGLLQLNFRKPGQLSLESVRTLESIAIHIGEALMRKHAQELLQRSYDSLEERVAQRTEELSRAEAGLQAALKAKSIFLANMSHELRTPLNSINGFAEILYDEIFGPLNPKQKKYVHNMLVSGKHLLGLINDVLDLARVDSGKMQLVISSLSLNSLITSSTALVREMALKKGITIQIELGDNVQETQADERKLREVVFNLLSNAINFTPPGGRIGVKTWRSDDGMLGVEVWDTGIGIAPENLDRIFEAFTRIEAAASVSEGSGLGLSLSRKLVELHGGRLWVESAGLDHGTQARFLIPIHQSKQA